MSIARTSTSTPKVRDTKLKEQELIQQIRAELVSTIRITPDEALADWQRTSIGQGYFSGTLESEIYRSFL
ncbi:hypothetical protein C7Y66_09710 [Chroococcidiopsis sp. CCALA 051]|uniref:hypothetical protein n=1 Tax=unclassified Chroococcidiopsis TaxID=2646205 RepID=UPI000D0CF967|nr:MULTISPECIES: hypothetical protein [unclassified Chroococcidiopsis]MBE9016962.1 hypothetical protein [Chroococcidiopsidales cyanobacterium LEGE 13417]PSM49372.1 hypothetical protein C7Y66_09710 [Chroococcidiopsis sp. CCALA 051]URD50160.1 hypothetical protein M5J74_28150 [Chroococcidiopsis sp. CCNUC1]